MTPPSRSRNGSRAFTPGEKYLPYNIFEGICIPLSLIAQPSLPARAKLVFGLIGRHLGDAESACLRLDGIAAEVGSSVDSIGRDIKQIETAGLLAHARTGRPNEFYFVWNQILASCLRTEHRGLANLDPGERYNPWKKFLFVLVPLSLLSWNAVSPGAKLMFGLVAYHARRGRCYVSDGVLRTELGASMAQLHRWRKELEVTLLIDYDAVRNGDNYHFHFQPILTHSLHQVGPPILRNLLPIESPPESAVREADSATSASVSAESCTAYKEEEIEKRELFKREEEIDRTSLNQSTQSEPPEDFVRRHLELLQGWIKTPLDSDLRTIPLLLKLVQKRGFSVYRLGSELYRLSSTLEKLRKPAGDIESWHYVVSVISKRLTSDESLSERGHRGGTDDEVTVPPLPDATQQGGLETVLPYATERTLLDAGLTSFDEKIEEGGERPDVRALLRRLIDKFGGPLP